MRSFDYNGVKRTECGWGGHFCLAYKCLFRRNTHLEYNGVKVVVSTVGNMYKGYEGLQPVGFENVGLDRLYETMAFYADPESEYDDADVSKEIYFAGKWSISPTDYDSLGDKFANDMHENCVDEIVARLKSGEL